MVPEGNPRACGVPGRSGGRMGFGKGGFHAERGRSRAGAEWAAGRLQARLWERCAGRAVGAPFHGLWFVTVVSQGVVLGYGWVALSVLGIQRRDSAATVSEGTNSAMYSFLANSPLVSQIVFQNSGATRMTTTKTYDYLNRLTQIASTPSASPAISFAYAYNNANQRTAVTNADGTYWLYGYDALGQVTSGIKFFNNGQPVPGEQFGYAFDNIGNRTSTTAGGDQFGNNLRTATYGANLNNQYTNRTVPGAVDVLGSAVTNAAVTVNNQPTYRNGMFYEATLALTNTSAAVWQSITNLAVAHTSSTTDLVATVTGNTFLQQTPEAFSYDSDGNLIQDGRWTYTWDAENRLIQMVSLTNAPTASKLRLTFGYDSKWRRISKAVEAYNGSAWTTNLAESFVYDGWNLVDELNATNNSVIRSYMWGLDLSGTLQGAGGVGGLLVVDQAGGGSVEFSAYDGNGNIAGYIHVANGTTASRLEYGPFGERVNQSDKTMAFGFSSRYADLETGRLYYGFRYYDAEQGRFAGRDPREETGGLLLYSFTLNNPIGNFDPLGLQGMSREQCAELLANIIRNANEIKAYFDKFDPVRDRIGGDISKRKPGVEIKTQPDGHRKQIGFRQKGLWTLIDRYNKNCLKKCRDDDSDGGGGPPVPEWVIELQKPPVPDPPITLEPNPYWWTGYIPLSPNQLTTIGQASAVVGIGIAVLVAPELLPTIELPTFLPVPAVAF